MVGCWVVQFPCEIKASLAGVWAGAELGKKIIEPWLMHTVDRGYGHNEEQIFLNKNLPKAQGLGILTNIDICRNNVYSSIISQQNWS